MSNVNTTVGTLSSPIRWGEKHSQAPLAGLDRSSQKKTGGEDGGRRRQFGNLAMEAEKASICSLFQIAPTPGPLSPSCRCHRHCSLTGPGRRQICGFLCSS
jgi:hypothetical protein